MTEAGESLDVLERKALEIVEHFPQTSKSYQFLGEFYNRCQRYSDAVAAFRKGIRQNPSDALLRWNLALAYQKQGRRRQAIAELRKALDIGLEGSLRRHATRLVRLLEASGS
jgi:tetratricopeptide (TPR) repeat protein